MKIKKIDMTITTTDKTNAIPKHIVISSEPKIAYSVKAKQTANVVTPAFKTISGGYTTQIAPTIYDIVKVNIKQTI
jgi:hypothetical protein